MEHGCQDILSSHQHTWAEFGQWFSWHIRASCLEDRAVGTKVLAYWPEFPLTLNMLWKSLKNQNQQNPWLTRVPCYLFRQSGILYILFGFTKGNDSTCVFLESTICTCKFSYKFKIPLPLFFEEWIELVGAGLGGLWLIICVQCLHKDSSTSI